MEELLQHIRSLYPFVKIWAFESKDRVELQQIEVPLEHRGSGVGTEIMEMLKSYAKSVGKPIVLRPEPDRGKKAALERFYKRLGFVDNAGRNKDYTLSAPFSKTMYWRFKEWLSEGHRELASMYKSKLGGVQQDHDHHPEGDVLAHSRLVRGAIKQAALTLAGYTGELGEVLGNIDFNLNAQELEILALAAWGHDIGKVTATGVDNGRIHARGHQDRDHFEPQLQDLGSVASDKTRQLYFRNKDLIDFLILHHMDFASGSFGRAFVAENFDGGRVKNTIRMKLLLILMWADKLGRGRVSLGSHERGLLKSAEMAAVRAGNIAKQSGSFVGGAAEMVALLRQRGQGNSVIRRSLQNKYGLSDEEIMGLLGEGVERRLILMRGISGSGKSTKAGSLGVGGAVYSTDDFFHSDGKYNFDIGKLGEYHAANVKRVSAAMERGVSPIVVDNTNIEARDMKPYVLLADKHNYVVSMETPDTPWAWNAEELARRNSHGVPLDTIQKMIGNYDSSLDLDKIRSSKGYDE